MKQRKCMNCATPFTPDRMGQKTCSPRCAYQSVEKAKDKAFDAVTRKKKKELKEQDRSYWIKFAQRTFNEYIRARDSGLPCISCGVIDPPFTTGGQWDAGHFKSRGAFPEKRFMEDNCHRQCKKCNGGGGKFSHKARTVDEQYEINLIERIGIDRVEAVKAPLPPAKYTIDELKAIQAHYKSKLRGLKNV